MARLGVQGFRHKVIWEPGGVRGDLYSLARESAGVQKRHGEEGRQVLEDRQEVAVWREGTGREPRCKGRGQAGSPGVEGGGRQRQVHA